jgi:hypothetical protein
MVRGRMPVDEQNIFDNPLQSKDEVMFLEIFVLAELLAIAVLQTC